jgi:glutathione synthase/RimK-type ligase-like ATP-grasp enzyme
MKLAIATCEKLPDLFETEKPLIALFRNHGIVAEPTVWNNPDVHWNNYDAVLIRSVWDYYLHADAFNHWLDLLEEKNIYTLNPVSVIRQNQNKFYLKQLEVAGVEIVPTVFIEKTNALSLSAVENTGWQKMVIKPAVSAAAFRTCLFEQNELHKIEKEFAAMAAECDLLVQPFIQEVNEQGEISLLFFNRQYSHAVLKVPKAGDFRVQQEHGGITTAFNADRKLIETAMDILSKIEGDLLYARVDGIIKNGRFLLMELELIEPYLFFDYHENAMEKFVSNAVQFLINRTAKKYLN